MGRQYTVKELSIGQLAEMRTSVIKRVSSKNREYDLKILLEIGEEVEGRKKRLSNILGEEK